MPGGKPPYRVTCDIAIAELPEPLAARLKRNPKPDRAMALEALVRIAYRLTEATEHRHDLLLWGAGQLGPWVRLGHLSDGEVYRALLDAYRDNGGLAEHGQASFDRTFNDGLEWGKPHKPNGVPERRRTELPSFMDAIEVAIRDLKGRERMDVITAKYRSLPEAQIYRGMHNAARRYGYEQTQRGFSQDALLLMWIEHFSDREFHRSQASAASLAKIMKSSHVQIIRQLESLETAGMVASAAGQTRNQKTYVIVPTEADFTGPT